MTQAFPGGAGAATGDPLVVQDGLYVLGSSRVYWVLYASGDNANEGTERRQPLQTLAYAISVAEDGDIIILRDGHTETITSTVTIDKQVCIVGEGSDANGEATVSFVNNVATDSMFSVTAHDVMIRNVYFPESINALAGNRILTSTVTAFRMRGCLVESGDLDTAESIYMVNVTAAELRNCRFVAVGSGYSQTVPGPGFRSSGSVSLKTVEFDGGDYGYGNGLAWLQLGASFVRVEGLTLNTGADVQIEEESSGYAIAVVTTGDARIYTKETGV